MAKTSSTSIGVTVTGDGETCTYVPPGNPQVNAAAPNGGTVPFVLSAGNNTLDVPTGATGVVIAPPTASANAKILKGVNGDTGIILKANAPTVLALDPGVTNFVINSAGVETLSLHWL